MSAAAAPGRGIWARPYALLPLPPLFWAGNLIIGRAFGDMLPPFGLTFWRWAIASAVMLPFVWRELRGGGRALAAAWPIIAASAATGFVGYPALNYIALHSTPAATAAILNSTLPFMIALFGWIALGQRPSPRMLAGIAVSFAGALWIVGRGDMRALASLSAGAGELMMIAAVACFAVYSLLMRRRPADLSPQLFLTAMMAAACVMASPLWIAESAAGRPFPVAPYAIASLLFISLFASLIGNAIWNRCVEVFGPATTGISFHLMAVYSAALAYLLLGEPLHRFHFVGAGLILAGLLLALAPKRERAATGRESQAS